MNIYLLPICDCDQGYCRIEKVTDRGITEARERFVKYLADTYDGVDYASTFEEAASILSENLVDIGDIYDIDEFQ